MYVDKITRNCSPLLLNNVEEGQVLYRTLVLIKTLAVLLTLAIALTNQTDKFYIRG